MIPFSEADVQLWLMSFLWPLTRVLAVIMAFPIMNNTSFPSNVKILFGIFIAALIAPTLKPVEGVELGSWISIVIFLRETLIGIALGLSAQVLFGAVQIAGELSGNQMGLGFATQIDPNTENNASVITQFIVVIATLIFFAMDGHLIMVEAMADSFRTLPIAAKLPSAHSWSVLATTGSQMFRDGLMMAAPVVAALGMTNVALGILTRVAPQLNVFSIGFPVMLLAGLYLLKLQIPSVVQNFETLWISCFEAWRHALVALR